MIIAAVIFFASVLVFPNMGFSKKPKSHLDKHRSYSQWERARHEQRRYSH